MGNLEALINNLKRTALITSISLATLVGVPNKSEAPIYAQDTKQLTIEQQTNELYNYLATQHTEIANSYKNAKLYTEAKQHYEKALHFTPEDKKIKEIITKLPEKNDAKEPDKARKTPDKKYENFKKEAIKKIEQTGKTLLEDYNNETNPETKQEKKYKTFQTLDLILEYDPTNETPFLLRDDFTKYEGTWQPKWMANNREQAKKLLTEANEGEIDNKPDDLTEEHKLKNVHRRKSEFVIAISTKSDQEAKEIHELLYTANKWHQQRFNITESLFDTYPGITEEMLKQNGKTIMKYIRFDKAEEFDNFWKTTPQFSPIENHRWGSLYFTWSQYSKTSEKKININPGIMEYPGNRSKSLNDESIINLFSRWFIEANATKSPTRNEGISRLPILEIGHSYLVGAYILNTSLFKEWRDYDDKYEGKGRHTIKTLTPQEMRKFIHNAAKDNEQMNLDYLINLKIEKYGPPHVAEAFTWAEYFNQEHPEQYAKLLTDQRRGTKEFANTPNTDIIKQTTGLTNQEFNDKKAKWARYNYAGFAYKN